MFIFLLKYIVHNFINYWRCNNSFHSSIIHKISWSRDESLREEYLIRECLGGSFEVDDWLLEWWFTSSTLSILVAIDWNMERGTLSWMSELLRQGWEIMYNFNVLFDLLRWGHTTTIHEELYSCYPRVSLHMTSS